MRKEEEEKGRKGEVGTKGRSGDVQLELLIRNKLL
jgi:hypothetical protein